MARNGSGWLCLPWAVMLPWLLLGCEKAPPPLTSAPATVASKDAAAAPDARLPEGAILLPYRKSIEHIGMGDLDSDGRQDLTFSAHVESYVETYYQQPERRFQGRGPVSDPGFHPNGTLILRGGDGAAYLALNAETANAVRSYRGEPDAVATLVGDTPVKAPFESTLITWPEWGQTLALTSKGGAEMTLVPGYDPALPGKASARTFPVTDRPHMRLAGLVVAPLGHQGQSVLLVAVPRTGLIVSVAPTAAGELKSSQLWDFGFQAAPEDILPLDFEGDGDTDLFVLGQMMADAVLLENDGQGKFQARHYPIVDPAGYPGVRGGALTREADGTLLLWASLEGGLGVLRWGKGASQPPERLFLTRAGRDPIRFVSGDLDADGHQDLVLGSAVGSLPPTVIFGPLAPKLSAIGDWLATLEDQSVTPSRPKPASGHLPAADKNP